MKEKCQRKSTEVTESLKGHSGQLEVKENYFIGFELSIDEQTLTQNQSELDQGQKLAEWLRLIKYEFWFGSETSLEFMG